MPVSKNRVQLRQRHPGLGLVHGTDKLLAHFLGCAIKLGARYRMFQAGVLVFDRVDGEAEVGLQLGGRELPRRR
ncbi:hypothetical protein GCM10011529_14730 [Polymorphobacter glacialis]|uniref:Uncharacterized protein n=1 Tax=Sandarakinorhabdus glacialis TaxID=1614636 RepID=A0A916ZRN9_9SPHN|nr:hypothetical protein GCM10011529_14730 [Polymorphobacter glacialis]